MATTVVRTPDGKRITVNHPDGALESEIISYAQSQYALDPSVARDDTTLLGRTGEFFKAIPREFLSSYASAAEGAGELADVAGLAEDDNPLTLFGRRANEAIQDSFAAAPGYEDLWTTKFGGALGSLTSFLTPGMALKALGYAGKAGSIATGAGLGATMTAGAGAQRVQQAREQGIEVSEETEDKAVMWNALIGLSEVAPVEKILRGLPADVLNQPFMKSFWPRLSNALGSGSVEAVQEVTSGLAQDVVEKKLYNPDLPVGQTAWDDLTLGGAAGATADLLLNAMAGRRITGITAEQRELEKKRRADEKLRLDEIATREFPTEPAPQLPYLPEVQSDDPVVAARALIDQNQTLIDTTFTSLETLEDGTTQPGLVVRDARGNIIGEPFKTPQEAGIFAAALNERAKDETVDQAIELAVDQSDAEYAPGERLRLRSIGRRLFHPGENNFTRNQVNYAAETLAENGYENEALTAQEAIDAGISPQKMTAAQRINAARIKRGERESNTFTVAEARAVLGDKFGRLAELQQVPIGANEKFHVEPMQAAAVPKKGTKPSYVVKSNFGETVYTRQATAKELMDNPQVRRVPFRTKQEAENYAGYLNGKRNDLISRADLRGEEEIDANEIVALLRAKNIASDINSPEVRSIAEAITGHKARGKTTIADMSGGERALLYQKLRSLPAFEKPTKLPNFTPRPYTPGQYRVAKQTTMERASGPDFELGRDIVPSREELEQKTGPLSQATYKRLLADLAADAKLARDIEVARNQARMRGRRDQRKAADEAKTKTQILQEQQAVLRGVRQRMKGYGLDRVGTTMVDYIRQARLGPKGEVQLGKQVKGNSTTGAWKPSLNHIFVAIEALKADPRYKANPSIETLERLAFETLDHEIVHAMRQADLFTQQEWETLERAARSTMKKDYGKSYTEWAFDGYPELSPVGQMEEAVAEMIRDGLSGDLRIGGQPRSLIRRAIEFIKGIIGIKNDGGYASFDDIVAAIRRGEIASRPEGEIRTLKELERLRGVVPERGIVARAAPGNQADEGAPGPVAGPVAQPGQSQPDFVEQRAYHGSPHIFSGFKMAHVGSGAGVQAQGYGLYFTTRRDLAEAYSKLNELIEPPGQAGEGALYEVEIDDAVIGRMLRMDLPLYKQDWIMGQLRAAANRGDPIANDMLARIAAAEDSYGRDSVKGSDLIEGMGRSVISMNTRISPRDVPKALSEYLLSLDIPGSIYGVAKDSTKGGLIGPLLEQLKPGAKAQMNLVAFNEQDIRIISRNGQPIEDEMQFSRRLEGMPEAFDVNGQTVEFGYHQPAVEAAKRYAKKAGINYVPLTTYAPLDADRGEKIAREFELLQHAPNDPLVKAAYEAMARETLAQYDEILASGLKVEFIRGQDPYGNPRNAILDIINNDHFWVFPTRDGFGSDAEFAAQAGDNILLRDSGKTDANGQPMLINDVFRVVHDYFGHVKNGVGFRARGEENAWQAHAAMYSPLARRAMTTETRGQNSWVNFGPHAEHNRSASPDATIYADQKMGLLPIWVSEEARLSERDRRNEPAYRSGLEGAIGADGRVRLSHFARTDISRTNPRLAGTGADAPRARRREYLPPVTYFGITQAVQNGYRRETSLGVREHVATLEPTALYPVNKDPEKLLADTYEQSLQNMQEAGFSGYWSDHPSLGKVAVVWDPLQVQPANDDMVYSRRADTASFTPERMSRLMQEYGYANGRVIAAVVEVDPREFVLATTTPGGFRAGILESDEPLDRARIAGEIQTPFMQISNGEIVGHEGRHRMAALAREGVRRAPIVIYDKHVPYDNETLGLEPVGTVRGERFGWGARERGETLLYRDPIDISYDNRPALNERYVDSGDMLFRRRVGTTGKYVGAPPGINSPQKLGALVVKLKKLTEEGEPGRFWYGRSGQAVLDFVGGDINEAEKLLKAIAVTSAGTKVDLNFRFALQAYAQHKAGHDIRTGRYPKDMSHKLQAIFDGKPWDGVNKKTTNFYNNLMAEIDPSRVLWEKGKPTEYGMTTDIWMMRAFGYYTDVPTDAQYKFVAEEIARLADQLKQETGEDWTPHQVQAAIWVAMKARSERSDVKKRTNELSVKKGWAKYVKNKKGKLELKILDKENHAKNWVRQAMKTDPTAEDTTQANFDYADAIDNNLGQIGFEVAPGSTTSHMQGALTAPMRVRKEFHRAMAGALLDKNGKDMLAKGIGVPSPGRFEAPGYWEDVTSPSTQVTVGLPLQYKGEGYEIEQSAEALVDAYMAAVGILFRQDAVGWHRPFFDPSISANKANGVEVTLGRPFTEQEMLRFGQLIDSLSGGDLLDPVSPPALAASPDGVRILNLGDNPLPNPKFREIVEGALANLRVDTNDKAVAKWFIAQGALLKHDWQGGSDGRGYLQTRRLAGRPDLQRRVRDVVAQIEPRVRAVEEEFADRYGWSRDSDLVYSKRVDENIESAGRPVQGQDLDAFRELERTDRLNPDAVAATVAQNKLEAERPFHAAPIYSPLASPEAQYIARHPELGLKPDEDMLFSLRVPQHGAAINTVTADPPTERGPFRTYERATGSLATPTRFGYFLTKAKQAAINRYARLEHLNWTTHLRDNLADTSSIGAAIMADRALGIVASAIRHGRVAYVNGMAMVINKNTIPELQKQNPVAAQRLLAALQQQGINPDEVQSLIEVMAPLYSKQYGNLTKAAQAYAMSRRSPRLRAEGKKTPTTLQQEREIEAEIAQYVDESGRNIIVDWYANWQRYNNGTVEFLRRTGVLDETTAQDWLDASDYYPFYRVAEGEGKNLHQGQRVFGGMTAAVHMTRLKGGESAVNMPLEEAITMNLSAAIQMGMKNVAQQRIVRDLRQLGLAEEVLPGHHSTAPTIRFRVNGKTREFAIYDPLVYESMLPLDGMQMVSFIKQTFGMPATALRELVTRDPGFMLVNLLRDSMSSYVTSGARLTPILSTFKGLFDGVERLEKLGVVGGYDNVNDAENAAKYWDRALREHHKEGPGSMNVVKRIWDALGKGTTASDAATRNAVFDDVFARTGNIAEAAFQGLEVINFSRHGSSPLIRMITAMVPFLNARFQGLDLLYRSYTGLYTANREKNRAQVAMSAVARGALLAAGTLMYYMLVSDDDQHKQATDWERDNYWIIPTSWGVPITIPIPFEVGLVYKTIPETIAAHHLGKKSGKEVRDTVVRGVGSTLEISPFQVQFLGPLMEAAINYNSFTGKQVVPQYMLDNTVAGLQYNDYSTEMAKFIGAKLNISPMKIDHAVTGYIGTMGQYVYDWIDVGLKSETLQGDSRAVLPERQWYDYPVIKRLVGKQVGGGLMQDAYDLWRDVSKVHKTFNSLKKDGRIDELQAFIAGRQHLLALRGPMNNVKNMLDKTRARKEMIRRSDMPSDMKHDEIEKLEMQINAWLGNVIPNLKQMADQPFYEPTFYE